MRRLDRILLIIAAVIIVMFSACLLSILFEIPVLTDFIKSITETYPPVNAVISVYAAFSCACVIVLIIAAALNSGKSGDVIIIKDKGKLRFSKQTIESTVKRSFAAIDGVGRSKIRAATYRKPEKTKIYVKLESKDAEKIAGMSEEIQKRIGEMLESSLCITAKTISIKVVELSDGNENHETAAKGGRVL